MNWKRVNLLTESLFEERINAEPLGKSIRILTASFLSDILQLMANNRNNAKRKEKKDAGI